MRISQMSDLDLMRTFKYISNLCGYPEVSQDKSQVLLKFIREEHGHNTDTDLISAFTALAAGRLEEKQDGLKSLTSLTASRVLQAYTRQKKISSKVDDIPEDKSVASEETIRLIQQYSNRVIRFNQEVTKDERAMLMDHWIGKQRENYKLYRRVDLLTSTSFDYLEHNGTLRIKDDAFTMWDGKTYIEIARWSEIEELGINQKRREDITLNQKNVEFRRMMSPSAGGSLKDAVKRVAMSIYFEHSN